MRYSMRSILVAWVVCAGNPAWARKPEDVFRRQVVIVGKRVPMRFSSAEGMISFLKSNRKEHLWPDREGKWKFEFMSFFAQPLDDFLVTVKFHEIGGGQKRFVQAYDENIAERGLRSLHSTVVLEKPEFQPNRKYRIAVTSRGSTLADAVFVLRGKGENYSGRVEFSDEEVRQP